MTRRRALVLGVVAALALVVVGFGYRGWRRVREPDVILPKFVDVPPGPRARTTAAFGLAVGRSRHAEAEAFTHELGLTCSDTSIRAQMARMRADKLREIDGQKARGENVDAVSKASWLTHKSEKEKNPQVRLSCERTPATSLTDRKRAPGEGRFLLVFDAPELPLRLASLQREHKDAAVAVADFEDAVAAATRAHGAPSSTRGEIPKPGDAGGVEIPPYAPILREWRFADLTVKVSLMNLGKRGIVMEELTEIPWPVRTDTLARDTR